MKLSQHTGNKHTEVEIALGESTTGHNSSYNGCVGLGKKFVSIAIRFVSYTSVHKYHRQPNKSVANILY
jgi:hypothetical protein